MDKANTKKLTPDEVAEALTFARQIVPKAGGIARRYFRQPLEVDNKLSEGCFDPVTCADREVEAYLRKDLGRRFPDFGIIGGQCGGQCGSFPRHGAAGPSNSSCKCGKLLVEAGAD